MDFDATVVMNEAFKFVHEKTYAGSDGADHLCKRLLADFRDDRFRLALLAKVRQQQERPGKTLFARIEQLIDEVCFDADSPAKVALPSACPIRNPPAAESASPYSSAGATLIKVRLQSPSLHPGGSSPAIQNVEWGEPGSVENTTKLWLVQSLRGAVSLKLEIV
jgi:hypothetical protein